MNHTESELVELCSRIVDHNHRGMTAVKRRHKLSLLVSVLQETALASRLEATITPALAGMRRSTFRFVGARRPEGGSP